MQYYYMHHLCVCVYAFILETVQRQQKCLYNIIYIYIYNVYYVTYIINIFEYVRQ